MQRLCLFLVFHPRIQASLNRTRDAWNFHKVRTAKNKTPVALWNLSQMEAISRGYWTGDPGDPADIAADLFYGCDGDAPLPPEDEIVEDPSELLDREPEATGTAQTIDVDLDNAREVLEGFYFEEDDGNWGIDVYLRAVESMYALMEESDESDDA